MVFHDPQQLSLKRLDKEGFVVGENVMGNNVLWKLWNRERDQASTTCIHLFRREKRSPSTTEKSFSFNL